MQVQQVEGCDGQCLGASGGRPLFTPGGKAPDLSSNKHLYTVHVADIFDTRSEEGNNRCIQHITQYLENRFVFPLADFEVRGYPSLHAEHMAHMPVSLQESCELGPWASEI
ncbi:hypothetical protein CapIbe_021790 [Capra ibex]